MFGSLTAAVAADRATRRKASGGPGGGIPLHGARTWYDIVDVPIWMAAGGPKGLKAAAAIADAVIYCLGPNPDMIKLVRRELDAAVEAAGREKAP